MLKSILLTTSMLIAAPVVAQTAPTAPESQPAQDVPAQTGARTSITDDAAPDAKTGQTSAEAAPQTAQAPATETAQPTPAQPAEMATQTAPDPAAAGEATPAATAATGPATPAAQPATSQDQVAQAVTRDFGTYDKDANGALSAAEFGSWMSTLRKASEPSFVPGSPEATKWEAQAFTAADADKSASVNQAELTTFLTPKPS